MIDEIADIAARASQDGRLAIDTEFVSERRYQSQLCLIQVSVRDPGATDGVRVEILDPLDEAAPLDPAPLAAVLADPAVTIVMHAGRQDVALLRRNWDTAVTNVFDTQVAAGFLGFGNQEGYEGLVRRVLKVSLGGGEGFTRWDRRPLTERQLGYAADDARSLLALGEELERRLEERGRLEWAREESRVIEGSDDVRSAERAYARLPKVARLDDLPRATAWAICEWREATAREIDRPPPSVVPDQVVVELARRRPKDRAGLESIRGLPQQTLHRRGAELLAQVVRGTEVEPPARAPAPPRRDAAEAPLVSLAQAVVRQRSLDSGVAPELIATQAELAALVGAVRRGERGGDSERVGAGLGAQPDRRSGRGGAEGGARSLRILHGWRRELVGGELSDLIAGGGAVSVGADGGLRVTPGAS